MLFGISIYRFLSLSRISVYRFLPLWNIFQTYSPTFARGSPFYADTTADIKYLFHICFIASIALQCFLGSAYIDFCCSGGSAYIDFYRSGIFSRHTAQHSPVVLLSTLIQQWTSNICSISVPSHCNAFWDQRISISTTLEYFPDILPNIRPCSHLLTYHGSSTCPTFARAPPFCILILICFSSLFSFSTPFSQLFTYYSLYFPSLNFRSSVFLYHVQRFAIGLFNQPLIHISVSSQSQYPLPSSSTADTEPIVFAWCYASKSIISSPTCSTSSSPARERGEGSCFRVRL